VYVAWRKHLPGNIRDVCIARSGDGGLSFGTPERVYPDNWEMDGCPHHGPSLAVGEDGRVHIAWYTGAKGQIGSKYASAASGTTDFGEPTRVEFTKGQETARPALAAGPDGMVFLAGEDWSGFESVIRFADVPGFEKAGPGLKGKSPSIALVSSTFALGWVSRDSVVVQIFKLR
jgi:hypothetical protein